MEVERWRYAAGVQTLPYGARELGARCGRVGVEEWSSGALEARFRRARRGGLKVWSAGGPCRRVYMKAWSSVGAGTWMHRGMELWRLASGVATWRHRGLEVWRRAVVVAMWRHGALEARCGLGDVEA